jgi:hypothetical protein
MKNPESGSADEPNASQENADADADAMLLQSFFV